MRGIKLLLPILGAGLLLVLIFIGVTVTAQAQEAELDDFPPPPFLEPPLRSTPNQPSGPVADHLAPSATDAISSTFLGAGDALVHGLIYAYDSLWASTRTISETNPVPARVLKINPDTLAVDERLELAAGLYNGEDIVAAEGYIWVILYTNPARLIRVDPTASPLTYDVALTFSGVLYGMSLDYAFGYLWAGCIDDIVQIDISDPLVPTYEVHDFAFLDIPPANRVFAHALTHDQNYMWTALYQYDPTLLLEPFFISDTVMKFDPITPTGSFTTTTVDVFFPDDIAYIGDHLYIGGETVSPSDMYQFTDEVVIYTSTFITDRVSFGTFAYPLDPLSVWAVYTNTPGTVKKFDLEVNELVELSLPSGYNDPSELAFDPAGNMYVSTWQDPAGIVKYTAPTSMTVNISKAGADAVLTWTHSDADATHYRIWRSTDPFFTLGDPGSEVIGEVLEPFVSPVVYTDTGAIADAGNNYYYGVQAVNGYGLASPLSRKVGEYSLTNSPGWNLLALPIQPQTAFLAEGMLDDIAADGATCSEVDRWLNGGWDPHIHGLPFNNFAILVDQGYFVRCTVGGTWNVVGEVIDGPETLSLQPGWNLVGVPYPPGGYLAESLLDEISLQGGNCSEVDRWLNGGWDPHIHGLPFNNFGINPDEGYFLRCTVGSSFTP